MDLDDRQRFEAAALPHLDAAYNLARWLTRDGHAAEDVVQEAYPRAAKFFGSFRGGDGRTWVLAVVRRAAYDWLARQRAAAAAPFDEEVHGRADDALDPAELADRAADREVIREAVEALAPEFREAIVLRELEGLSYQQIAAVAGVPVGTVMSRLSRARKQFQGRLAPHTGEGD